MMRTSKRALTGACTAALLGAGGLLATTSAAAATPAFTYYTCHALTTAPFYSSPGGGDSTWVYSVAAGGTIYSTGQTAQVGSKLYINGHGAGHSDEWFRAGDTNC
ncbi:hypothetical protein V2S66_23205 [Streptomyces sp. V4-01]|uniref:Uncharacterized protein n=1 Tax=Actinacidiphila polyblastidii TaxID=3110430 RepID=A0ABU7PGB6_9ACTN|nr:hypothetical protein [Streptomyces sp. V4-01]